MTKQKKEVTDNNVTSVGELRYFDPIPVDLVIKILSLLPVKSKAKCRSVWKLWSSIIRRPNHDQLFPIKSPATPRFLFIRDPGGLRPELFFYSSPHPPIPLKNSSLIYHHHTNSVTDYYQLCPPIAGLVCRQHFGENYILAVITNPVTGEYVTTPKVTTAEKFEYFAEMYFGYDPIDKIFKVLCRTCPFSGSYTYQVLTLETGKLSWRNVQCCIHHIPQQGDKDKGICINGVLYFTATSDSGKRVIVCFDVRSEKFSFIDIPDENLATHLYEPLIMIDYKGELGVIDCVIDSFLNLWVLKNAEEHKWSNHRYEMPEMSHPNLTDCYLDCAGMIGTDRIVLYNYYTRNPFNIFCYNLEKNVITKEGIVIPTVDWWTKYRKAYIFTNFIEDAKLMF